MQTLQNITGELCDPEVIIQVTPEGNPVQITTLQGTYQWPDLYQGVAATPDGNAPGFITPYIGNVASGTYTEGATYRTYAHGTTLTFSGSVYNVPSGVQIVTQEWSFGDGFSATGPVATHVYQFVVPQMTAVLGVGFSNGVEVFVPKQISLT